MSRFFRGARLAPLCLLLLVAGCGDDEADTPTDPTPVVVTKTETFEDTIGANGARTFPFASGSGTMTATLTTVSTGETQVVGLLLGLWNGASCQVVIANDAAKQAVTVVGQATSPANFCVRVYDVGFITEPVTFVVQVVHRE